MDDAQTPISGEAYHRQLPVPSDGSTLSCRNIIQPPLDDFQPRLRQAYESAGYGGVNKTLVLLAQVCYGTGCVVLPGGHCVCDDHAGVLIRGNQNPQGGYFVQRVSLHFDGNFKSNMPSIQFPFRPADFDHSNHQAIFNTMFSCTYFGSVYQMLPLGVDEFTLLAGLSIFWVITVIMGLLFVPKILLIMKPESVAKEMTLLSRKQSEVSK